MSEYDYLAESTGIAIGRRQGERQGYEAGFNDADSQWRSVNQEWRNAHDALKAECEALRKENTRLRQTIDEGNYGLTSFHVIALCFLDALKHLSPKVRTEVAFRYYQTSKQWILSKHLRTVPADDPLLQKLAPRVASEINSWCKQELAAEQSKSKEGPGGQPKS
ncbi:hypothetical protein [Pseudomonas oryzihabitans]|uniref:hypothetical protein n=1 Tax=Pseudomonas oryzihabitans TaxID=47885 RepID=UPI002893AF6E|nr:hypothetical protein [Pseudomonas oryzihabitans]MDT3723007.1 hypothetical protein [Pseudomonas oryzihabitans]